MESSEFKWKKEYSVGINAVDQQHKRYIKIINDLKACIADKSFEKRGYEIFFSLVHFADNYLFKEKMLVNTIEGVDYSFFRCKHKEFLNLLIDFQKECEKHCSEQLFVKLYKYLISAYPDFLSYYTPTLVKILKSNGLN